MLEYRDTVDGLNPDQLTGFFEGWPDPPSPARHLDILRHSSHVTVAFDRSRDRAVGFINAISDGTHAAYIPLLEVLPGDRGRGIGTELVRRMLARLSDFYMIDLVCDAELVPFYERLGMLTLATAVSVRNMERQSGDR